MENSPGKSNNVSDSNSGGPTSQATNSNPLSRKDLTYKAIGTGKKKGPEKLEKAPPQEKGRGWRREKIDPPRKKNGLCIKRAKRTLTRANKHLGSRTERGTFRKEKTKEGGVS